MDLIFYILIKRIILYYWITIIDYPLFVNKDFSFSRVRLDKSNISANDGKLVYCDNLNIITLKKQVNISRG
jgi:hypothetical protein